MAPISCATMAAKYNPLNPRIVGNKGGGALEVLASRAYGGIGKPAETREKMF